MEEAYQKASTTSTKNAKRSKRYYDRKVRSSAVDRVLVCNLTPRGDLGKLRSHWEGEVYVVVKRKGPGSPVYEVRAETKAGKR